MPHLPLLTMVAFAVFGLAAVLQAAPPDGDHATAALTNSPRHGEWVDIDLPDHTKLHTWVSYPERSDKAPVVLVIHEIFGMSDWVRATADALAAEGFIAIAPDFLSGKGPDGGNTESFQGDGARAAVGKLTGDEVAARLDAAKGYAATIQAANADKLGVIGFCWGGGQSFSYAIRQPALSAAVVYYGVGPGANAAQDVQLPKIHAPVLGFYGGDDARVTGTVEHTRATMTAAGNQYEPVIYPGAGHGFLRQQTGRDGANQKAADAAWTRTIAFLHEQLGK